MKNLSQYCIVTGAKASPGGRTVRLYDRDDDGRVEIARYYVNPNVTWTPALRAEKEAAIRASITPTVPAVDAPAPEKKKPAASSGEGAE